MVSVIIPMYNGEKYVREAMDSVLSQSYSDFEIIAIDDCGYDGTMRIIEEYAEKDMRIRIIRNDSNKGIAYSRNRAMAEARGEYIALLDDDDVMCQDRLMLQVNYLEQNPEIGCVGGNAIWIDENNIEVRGMENVITEPNQIKMFLLLRNIFNNGEMMFRRSIAERYGLQFGENCYGMEDFYFWIHFSKVAKITNLKELVLKKRHFSLNETAKMQTEYAAERRQKYHELQLLSLELSGFQLDDRMRETLLHFFGEEQQIPQDYEKIGDVYYLLDELIKQADRCAPEVVEYMQDWFLDIMESWYHSTWKWNSRRWACLERGEYYDRLVESEKWHNEHEKVMEKVIREKDSALEWHVQHEQDMENYIREKDDALEWHVQHEQDMEDYIHELEQRS